MTDSQALQRWQRKLAYLQEEEAIESDAAQKFELRQQIEECEAKIAELSKPVTSQGTQSSSPIVSIAHLPPAGEQVTFWREKLE